MTIHNRTTLPRILPQFTTFLIDNRVAYAKRVNGQWLARKRGEPWREVNDIIDISEYFNVSICPDCFKEVGALVPSPVNRERLICASCQDELDNAMTADDGGWYGEIA